MEKVLFQKVQRIKIRTEDNVHLFFFISIAMLMQTFLIEIFIKAIVDSHAVVKKIIQRDPLYTLPGSSQW